MFSASTYNATIDEDVREDMIVVRLTASDGDTAPNAMLRYEIISSASESDMLSQQGVSSLPSLSLHATGPPGPVSPSDPTPPSGSFIIDEILGDIRTQGHMLLYVVASMAGPGTY